MPNERPRNGRSRRRSTTRRRTLAATVAAATIPLAGCSDFLEYSPDVVVFNRTDEEVTADVTLSDADGERLLSETATIEPSEASEHDDVLPSSGQVTLSVAVEGGPSDEADFDVSGDTSVQARIDADAIQFDQE